MIKEPILSPSTQSLAASLRIQIESRGAGAKLPTVRSLMKEFGVGQAIVQQAIDLLEQEGLVIAEVGRGTFVRRTLKESPGEWSAIILNHERPGLRGQIITSRLHEQLLAGGHRSVVITYSDLAHAADLVRSMPAVDVCIIRPQSDLLPAGILATIQSKCRAVIVEGVPMEHVDVDSVATDWLLALETAIRHLRSRRHDQIGLVLGQRDSRYARDGARFFRSLTRLASMEDAPVVYRSEDGLFDASPLADCSGVIAWGALAVQLVRDAGVSLPIVALENPDLTDPSLHGLTIIGRPSDRIATAVIERIEHRLKNPASPFVAVYDKPKLVVAN